MRLRWLVLLIVALGVLPACEKKAIRVAQPEDAVAGEQAKAGAFLAYEHAVRIALDERDAIPVRIAAVRDACADERFGACSLLSLEQDSGRYPDGRIVVRIVPAGVEPLVKLAAEGGAIRSRKTSAEDLAQAVADNAKQRELLMRQRAKFEELQVRKDLAVADRLALARELTALEVQLDTAEQASAQQRRRIETNRLTIDFTAPSAESENSRIGNALRNLWDSFSEGVADAIEYVGYLLPFLVLGFPLLLLMRWLWRRATRPRGSRS